MLFVNYVVFSVSRDVFNIVFKTILITFIIID